MQYRYDERMTESVSIGFLSYGLASAFFLGLTVLLMTAWRGRAKGAALAVASAVTAAWAAILALQADDKRFPIWLILDLELLRVVAWAGFLMVLLRTMRHSAAGKEISLRWALLTLAVLGSTFVIVANFPGTLLRLGLTLKSLVTLQTLLSVLLAVLMLMLVEQLYRNTRPDQRWGIKFLCLGAGGMFVYDFYLYADALLFNRIDADIWFARGAINAIVVPFLAVAAKRNPDWSVEVFVSRRFLLYTTTLVGAGVYLIAMASAGYYLRYHGGEWGTVLQMVFLVGAGLVLVVLMFSGHLRAKLKVFLSTHFFSYKYDYRDEWTRLMRTLSGADDTSPMYQRVIRGIAEILESPGGALWMNRDTGRFDLVQRWNIGEFDGGSLDAQAPLLHFLETEEWVMKLDEYDDEQEFYGDLHVPEWLFAIPQAWLVVPLIYGQRLRGVVLLMKPKANIKLIWEDMDLVKLAARQGAAYLAQHEAAQALADARQFEAFNRFSAFVVHDLKNLIAQLSLVVRNAERHRGNPAFVDDAIRTISHSVERMNNLMQHLRSSREEMAGSPVELAGILRAVVDDRTRREPAPVFVEVGQPVAVHANGERLGAVLGHLIDNAQEATPKDGSVEVKLTGGTDTALIEIIDTGAGMDETFIRDRLFRPFDSTKGLTGMGIGVYEAREYVRSLGGSIQVTSKPRRGTHFKITIPLARDAQSE